MKTVLPTLFDESILLAFGLDKSVPVAYSEIKAMVDAADGRHGPTANVFHPSRETSLSVSFS
jgi:hypothetical protein